MVLGGAPGPLCRCVVAGAGGTRLRCSAGHRGWGQAGRGPLQPWGLSCGRGLQLGPRAGSHAAPQLGVSLAWGSCAAAGPAWCWGESCWALCSPAALGAGAAVPCSTIGEPCTAPQHGVQTLHGPVALPARPASRYRARREPRVALQRCLRVPRGPAAPLPAPARPCSARRKPCSALRYRARAPCAPAAPLAGPPGPCGAFRGTRSPHGTSCGSGPRRGTEHKSWPRRPSGAPPPTPGARAWAARAGQRGRGRCRCRREAGSCRGTTGRRRGCSGAPAPLRRPPGLRGTVGMRGERVQFLTYPTHVFF
ncbi:translation initiation factor IF-2-like [Oxyura jamaicensis]|uniref:translation initiation factor IF-2-like n=1 Tax=Oxyura jamaicensis TaxID=8884 RepID=UPI0015A5B79E|nr:translation initiation factor IF-2-like [Oxyura jamaicensis]